MRLHRQDVGGGDRGGKRAAGAAVGDQDGLLRIEELGCLGHEMDATLDDGVGLDPRGLDRQLQAVAHDVGDPVIDLRRLVIVGEDDSVLLAFQLVDLEDQRRIERPFDLGDTVPDLFENRPCFLFDRLGEFEIEIGSENGARFIDGGDGVDLLEHKRRPRAGPVARPPGRGDDLGSFGSQFNKARARARSAFV